MYVQQCRWFLCIVRTHKKLCAIDTLENLQSLIWKNLRYNVPGTYLSVIFFAIDRKVGLSFLFRTLLLAGLYYFWPIWSNIVHHELIFLKDSSSKVSVKFALPSNTSTLWYKGNILGVSTASNKILSKGSCESNFFDSDLANTLHANTQPRV